MTASACERPDGVVRSIPSRSYSTGSETLRFIAPKNDVAVAVSIIDPAKSSSKTVLHPFGKKRLWCDDFDKCASDGASGCSLGGAGSHDGSHK